MFACCFLITEVFEIVNREREIHHVKDVSENFEKNFEKASKGAKNVI